MVSEGEVCRVDKTFSIKDYHDEETFCSKEKKGIKFSKTLIIKDYNDENNFLNCFLIVVVKQTQKAFTWYGLGIFKE